MGEVGDEARQVMEQVVRGLGGQISWNLVSHCNALGIYSVRCSTLCIRETWSDIPFRQKLGYSVHYRMNGSKGHHSL